MKRVYALHRVSTKGQVDKDDIPMQKKACREFAERQNGWTIIKEFSEQGVSGFKVSADKRDAIQELKAAAERHEFDVLLVYMFDRLGRRQNETPFIVEWFIQQGIEVWSTQEGQQRFENEADYLINFMRYWQAGGESRKTSTRVKTRLKQLTEEGVYTGGVTPFGYKLVKSGKVNKRGKELMDIVPDEGEAPIVREIFEKTVKEGYGSYRMATYLNQKGIRTHNGSKFQCNTVNRILANKMYCGYFVSGETESPFIEKICIIDKTIFDIAQRILRERSSKNEEKTQIARTTKGNTMLSGNIYCAHCGNRLNSTSYIDRYTRSDGSESTTRRRRYICCGKAMKRNGCDGQTAYVASRVDKIVAEIMKEYFARIKITPKDVALELRYEAEITELKSQLKILVTEEKTLKRKLKELTSEIASALLGESSFTPEILSTAIEDTKQNIETVRENISECQIALEGQRDSMEKIEYHYEQFRSWADEFETASLERKKMIACNLFREIRVGKGYDIELVMDVSYEQFFQE